MKVKLNAWRGEHGPGEVIDLDEGEAATMIHHGTAFAHDDLDAELEAAEAGKAAEAPAAPPAPRVVKGSASLEAATGTDGKS